MVLPGQSTPGVDVNIGSAIQALSAGSNAADIVAALKSTDPFTGAAAYDLMNLYNQPNGKNQTITFADLGGTLIYYYAMKSTTESDNATEQNFSGWSLWDPNA